MFVDFSSHTKTNASTTSLSRPACYVNIAVISKLDSPLSDSTLTEARGLPPPPPHQQWLGERVQIIISVLKQTGVLKGYQTFTCLHFYKHHTSFEMTDWNCKVQKTTAGSQENTFSLASILLHTLFWFSSLLSAVLKKGIRVNHTCHCCYYEKVKCDGGSKWKCTI